MYYIHLSVHYGKLSSDYLTYVYFFKYIIIDNSLFNKCSYNLIIVRVLNFYNALYKFHKLYCPKISITGLILFFF